MYKCIHMYILLIHVYSISLCAHKSHKVHFFLARVPPLSYTSALSSPLSFCRSRACACARDLSALFPALSLPLALVLSFSCTKFFLFCVEIGMGANAHVNRFASAYT